MRSSDLQRGHARVRAALGALVLLAATASGVKSQGTITIAAGAAPSIQIAPSGKFMVPIIIDMNSATGANLASLAASVTWGASQLTLDSVRTAGFGTLTTNSAAGSVSLALFSATGLTATITVATLYFAASAAPGGTSVQVSPSAAGNEAGASLTAMLRARSADVCVAPLAPFGDVTADNAVNIIDAQQIARFSVGLSVGNPSAMALVGDVTADGLVNIIDAQQIARFSVGLAAAARIGTSVSASAPVASVAVSPATPSVGVGQSTLLTATPQDASHTPLTGCAAVTWSSNNPAVATVNASGVVTAVTVGSATITATSAGISGTSALTTFVGVASLLLTPDTATIHMGEPLQLTATPRDAAANALAGRTVTYASSDTTIATVSGSGLVTSKTVGLVTITAASETKRATTTIQVSPLAAASLAVGDTHVCALTVTGAAWCWGSVLGDGSNGPSSVPVPVAVPQSVRFTQIAAGNYGTCALTTQATVYCWGSFSLTPSVIPIVLSSTFHPRSIALGSSSGCGLDAAGAGFCWGRNGSNGLLGTGDTASAYVPRAVSGGLVFGSIGLALFNGCGLTTTGAAYCWGSNSLKTLGIAGTPATSYAPGPVMGGLTFTSLTAGAVMTCGVVAGGTAWCWGTNYNGMAGAGSTVTAAQATPTAVASAVNFRVLMPGTGNDIYDGICGLATDGTAYCWGSNSSGQIGSTVTLPGTCSGGGSISTFGCTGVPTAVMTSEKFNALGVGAEQVCGLTMSRTLLCWGRNTVGQLGDGTLVNRSTPVAVLGTLRLP